MKRISILGPAALCAFALAVVGAPSAFAAETTAYTCVAGGGGSAEFSDADCQFWSVSGTYGHSEIATGTNTQLTAKKVGTLFFLDTEIGGASVSLSASGLECVECMVQNSGFLGSMGVSGSGGKLKLTGVTVTSGSASCFVESSSGKGVVLTEPLAFEATGTNSILVKPQSGTALAKFQIKAQVGGKCAIAGSYTVSGDFTAGSEGAILWVLISAASKTLKVGVNGAELVGEATISAGNTPSEAEPNPVHNPVALT
jgi:hypothetical protein